MKFIPISLNFINEKTGLLFGASRSFFHFSIAVYIAFLKNPVVYPGLIGIVKSTTH